MRRATRGSQEMYTEPVKAELITARLRVIRDVGATVVGALSPPHTMEIAEVVVYAGVSMFVFGGTTVSAEHGSSRSEPLTLKELSYELVVPTKPAAAPPTRPPCT